MEKQQQEQEQDAVDVEETEAYEPEAPVVADAVVPVVVAATGLLSADEILAADDLDYEDVPIPEWTPGYRPGDASSDEPLVAVRCVRLRVMTGEEAIQFTEDQENAETARDTMIRLVATCAVDERNEPLFTRDQVVALSAKSFPVFKRLQRATLLLNGLATEEPDGEDAQEATKNA